MDQLIFSLYRLGVFVNLKFFKSLYNKKFLWGSPKKLWFLWRFLLRYPRAIDMNSVASKFLFHYWLLEILIHKKL